MAQNRHRATTAGHHPTDLDIHRRPDGVVIEQGGEKVRLVLNKLPEGPVLPRLTIL